MITCAVIQSANIFIVFQFELSLHFKTCPKIIKCKTTIYELRHLEFEQRLMRSCHPYRTVRTSQSSSSICLPPTPHPVKLSDSTFSQCVSGCIFNASHHCTVYRSFSIYVITATYVSSHWLRDIASAMCGLLQYIYIHIEINNRSYSLHEFIDKSAPKFFQYSVIHNLKLVRQLACISI